MREKVVNFFDKGMFGYKMLYFVLVLLSFNSLCARTTGLSYLTYIVAFLGAVFLVFRLFRWKNYIDTRGILFLVLFCISYALSSILMRQYGLMENIQAMIWMAIQFFAVYAYDKSRAISEDKREIKIIGWFFIGYTFVLAAAALVMFIVGYYHYRPVVDNAVITGFLWNRLWGLYSDPNYGAVFSIKYNKPFAAFIRESNQNKLGELLSHFGLADRSLTSCEELGVVLRKKIEFERINAIINEEKKRSEAYLDRVIKEAIEATKI